MYDEDEMTLKELIKQASKDTKEVIEEDQLDAEKSENVNNEVEIEQKSNQEEALVDEAEDSAKDSYKSESDAKF